MSHFLREMKEMLRGVALVLVLLLSVETSWGKVFERCDLAKKLIQQGIPKLMVPDWLCLVKAESGYNTKARYYNPNGSVDYGLFQINNRYWCSNRFPEDRECKMTCNNLTDGNISDDVACATLIYSRDHFNAWNGWKDQCQGKDLSSYVRGCEL